MKLFLRWLGRALFALLILALLAATWVCWVFQQWKTEKIAALDAGSKIVQTSAGPMEYTESGNGPVVLICHGPVGGYDQAALIGGSLAKDGFRVLAPSRPGFLRTPLATGLLFEDQADALAALLDTLGIKKASVLGFSTGAQVALNFAARHPDRTDALVLIASITTSYRRDLSQGPEMIAETALFKTTGDMGTWLFVKQAARDPRWMLDRVFAADTKLQDADRARLVDFVLKNPDQLAFFQKLVGSQAPLSPRESGTRNDLILVRALDPFAYEKIQTPILLVNGTADVAAPWTDLKPITDQLPFAKVLWVKDTGELVWFGPNAANAQKAVADFLKNPPPVPTPTPTPTPAPTPAAG